MGGHSSGHKHILFRHQQQIRFVLSLTLGGFLCAVWWSDFHFDCCIESILLLIVLPRLLLPKNIVTLNNSPSAWTLHKEQSSFISCCAVNPMKHRASPNNDQPEKRTCPVYCKDMFSAIIDSERSSTAIPHQYCHIHQITISRVIKTPELVLRLHSNNRNTDGPIFSHSFDGPRIPHRIEWGNTVINIQYGTYSPRISATYPSSPHFHTPIRTCFVRSELVSSRVNK
jgi:hypothetical protein